METAIMDSGSKEDWKAFEKVFGPLGKRESKRITVVRPVYESPFSLPRRWDGKDIYSDLSRLYDNYKKEVKRAFKAASPMYADVLEVCDRILDILRTYLHGYPAVAYEKMRSLMLLLEKEPLYAARRDICDLYRMSKVSENINDKERIFHAPYNIRPKIRPYRYSIAGYPSLYLAESLELAEEEMQLFKKKESAIAARFEFSPAFKQPHPVKIIDFGIRPQDLAFEPDNKEAPERVETTRPNNEYRKKLERAVRYSDLHAGNNRTIGQQTEVDSLPQRAAHKTNAPMRYILWYPLIAACSYVRTNREDPFAPEYIVPQLMTQWMRSENTGELVGIRYFSCYSRTASEKGCNYVFPTSGDQLITTDGLRQYCPVLNEAFVFTETEFTAEYSDPAELEPVLKNKYPSRLFPLSKDEFKKKTEVIIPKQTMYIGARAFLDCNCLESIDIPDSVLGIGDNAFFGCSSLKKVKLPERLTSVSDEVFGNCTNLERIDIPKEVVSIGSRAFVGCYNLKEITVSPENHYYYSENGCLIKISGPGALTVIAALPEITGIPDNVTCIGESAFEGFKGLSLKQLPVGLTRIDDSAFMECTKLKLATLPKGLTSIGDSAFKGCTGLKLTKLPKGLTNIGWKAFYGCTGLKLAKLPDGLTSIRSWAFSGCETISEITLPKSLTEIGRAVFNCCEALKRISYSGTKEQWLKLNKRFLGVYWDYGTPDYTFHFADGTVMTKKELHAFEGRPDPEEESGE